MIPDSEHRMQVVFDVHQYDFPADERDAMLADFDSLSRQVTHFPVADLHVHIQGNRRSNDVSLKLSLILPGQTLVTQDHDQVLPPALERCLIAMADSLQKCKARLGHEGQRQHAEKGTDTDLQPSADLDLAVLDGAVDAGDYSAFREATLAYEEGVRKRAGRWVQRYPAFEAKIGKGISLDDVVEEVFLMAFEGYADRPKDVRMGEWLEHTIDAAVKALAAHPDEELENINLSRAARAADRGAG